MVAREMELRLHLMFFMTRKRLLKMLHYFVQVMVLSGVLPRSGPAPAGRPISLGPGPRPGPCRKKKNGPPVEVWP